MKVLLFGEKYSDNLGDGVISECLAYSIKFSLVGADVTTLDLSLRDRYSIGESNENNSIIPNRPTGFISKARRVVGWLTFRKKQASLSWSSDIRGADIVAIGGGQLFLNRDLNFPVKIYMLSRLLKDFKGRIVILACGASKINGFVAKFFLRSLLAHKGVSFVSVRDSESIENMCNLNEKNDTALLHDPAFISADCYRPDVKKSNVVGLNIMDFHTLNSLLGNGGEAEYIAFWLALIERLRSKNYEVKLFTNGASEDNSFMFRLSEKLSDDIECIVPKNPKMLVETVSLFSLVFAHRLHANIISYANEVPSVGFIWGEKVAAFSRLTEREGYFVHDEDIFEKVDYIVGLGDKAISEGVDKIKLKEIKAEFYEKLGGALDGSEKRN